MPSDKGRRGEPTPGRNRDAGLTSAILAATSELLFEGGYDQLRVQHVADRAGVGTGAIYRRWETKEALVAEAIRVGPDPSPSVGVTSDAMADLESHVRGKAEVAAARPDLLPGLISAMLADPLIDAAMRERYSIAPIRDALASVIGHDHRHLELLAELVPAVALHRTSLGTKAVDPEAFTNEVLALITDIIDLPQTQ